MVTPNITQYPGDIPSKGQIDTVFDQNIDDYLTWQVDSLAPEFDSALGWIAGQVEDITAIAMAGDLPSLTGRAGTLLRVKADETGLEFLPTGTAGRAVLASELTSAGRTALGLVTEFLIDQDDFSDNSATRPPSQQSVNQRFGIANAPGAKAALNAAGSAPIYACRAWVNFNGTGTVAIRASGNVSSVTDNGAGDYSINFSVAMIDANYAAIGTAGDDVSSTGANRYAVQVSAQATSSVRVHVNNHGNAGAGDPTFCNITVTR